MSVILATAGYDHKIRFWEAPSGVCSRVIKYPDSQVNKLQITPDKQFIAAAGNPHIRLYEILSSNGAVESNNNNNNNNGVGNVGVGGGGIDPPTQQPVLTLEGHTAAVTSIGFQKDGRYLYSGSEDGTIKVWDLRNNSYSRSFDCKGGVNSVTLRTDRDEFISGDQNGCVKVWDLGGNGCIHSVKPSSAPLASEVVMEDNNSNNTPSNLNHQYSGVSDATTSGAGQQQQQPRKRSTQRSYHEGTVPIQAVDISEDSRTIVACSNHGTVFVWKDEKTNNGESQQMQYQQQQQHHPHQQQHNAPPNNNISTSTTTSDLLSQPLHTRFRAHNNTNGNYCLHGKMAPDGRHFVTTGSDGYALLWNTTTWKCAQRLSNQKWVYDAAFCADSSYLVTASSDNIARLWNLRTGDVVRQYHGHQSAVITVALNDSSV